MTPDPGADELRIRSLLVARGVGPDAIPPKPVAPPKPTMRPRDWLDDLLAPAPPPAPAAEEGEAPEPDPVSKTDDEPVRPQPFAPHPGYWPRPHMPDVFTHAPERAVAAISPRTRSLLYNASAAGTGWLLGLYDRFAAAIADCGANYSTGGALVLGVGGSVLIAHVWDRRTRHWWPGIAWAARIPLATVVLAVALWAPAAS